MSLSRESERDAWEAAAREAMESVGPGARVELFLREETLLTAEPELLPAACELRQGLSVKVCVRVWRDERLGTASGRVAQKSDLVEWVQKAWHDAGPSLGEAAASGLSAGGLPTAEPYRAVPENAGTSLRGAAVSGGRAAVLPADRPHPAVAEKAGASPSEAAIAGRSSALLPIAHPHPAVEHAGASLGEASASEQRPHLLSDEEPLPALSGVSAARVRARGLALVAPLSKLPLRPQALWMQERKWRQLLLGGAREQGWQEWDWAQVTLRLESARGALVEGWAHPHLEAPWEEQAAFQRLQDACAPLQEDALDINRALPLLMRPAVAATYVWALGTLLRGDVAQKTPALLRALGKRLFPSVLTLRDTPAHPLGLSLQQTDDEGRDALPLDLIEAGVLRAFLHTQATAQALGHAPNARAQRLGADLMPLPAAFNLHVVEGALSLPSHYTELTTRLETFSLMPKLGTLSLIVAGWEWKDGVRVRAVAPFALTLPVLASLRQLKGVGSDLQFLPALEGVGSPSLLFDPLV